MRIKQLNEVVFSEHAMIFFNSPFFDIFQFFGMKIFFNFCLLNAFQKGQDFGLNPEVVNYFVKRCPCLLTRSEKQNTAKRKS